MSEESRMNSDLVDSTAAKLNVLLKKRRISRYSNLSISISHNKLSDKGACSTLQNANPIPEERRPQHMSAWMLFLLVAFLWITKLLILDPLLAKDLSQSGA